MSSPPTVMGNTHRNRRLLSGLAGLLLLGMAYHTAPPLFDERMDMGLVAHAPITEASGLVASRQHHDVWWTHNDSGDESRIFALANDGSHLGTYYLTEATNRDWEDLAIGPGPVEGRDYLFVGDIGDNAARHDIKYIYRVAEPLVPQGAHAPADTLHGVEALAYRYPDGPRDAETLLADPHTGDLYIVSKREEDVRVYRMPYPQSTTEVTTLVYLLTLDLTQVTGGDFSPDGTALLLKTYTQVYYWSRKPEQSWKTALEQSPQTLPYVFEPQGEAIAWASDGNAYVTLSEERNGIAAHLYLYPRMYASAEGTLYPYIRYLAAPVTHPATGVTTVTYLLPETAPVHLTLHGAGQQAPLHLVDHTQQPGRWEVAFPYLTAGTYTLSLITPGDTLQRSFTYQP